MGAFPMHAIGFAPIGARDAERPVGMRGSGILRGPFSTTLEEKAIKFLRMKPGHGELVLAEGDPRVREEEELLVQEFRRQLDLGMWAAVPTTDPRSGRREADLVQNYSQIPPEAERVIFFPRAAGG